MFIVVTLSSERTLDCNKTYVYQYEGNIYYNLFGSLKDINEYNNTAYATLAVFQYMTKHKKSKKYDDFYNWLEFIIKHNDVKEYYDKSYTAKLIFIKE